jgi:hypothetical protein
VERIAQGSVVSRAVISRGRKFQWTTFDRSHLSVADASLGVWVRNWVRKMRPLLTKAGVEMGTFGVCW